MKIIKPLLASVLVALMALPSYAQAQQSIAVVNTQMLLSSSDAAKDIQAQVKKQRESFLKSVSKQEQDLRKTEKDIIEKKADLSQDEFTKQKQDFEKKFLETRNMAQKQKVKLDQAAIKAMAKLEGEIYKVVQEIADEKKIDLVLAKQSVVIGSKSLDISQDALKKLNKSVSKIKLEL